MKHYTIPVFVPELACPNRCVFCNQHSISGCHDQPSIEMVKKLINERLKDFQNQHAHVEIGFFGGNFTGIEESLQKAYLSIAKNYLDEGEIQGIRLSTRPDYITVDSLNLLKDYNVSTIELGAQSLHDDVLLKAGRGHTSNDVRRASQLIRDMGFKLGLQMMTGLPGDTPQKAIETARTIIELGAICTRIYPTLVIKNTDLEKEWLAGHYKPQSLEEAVDLAADLIELFESHAVNVIRVGLHPSEDLIAGKDLLAGPFHVSLRQLADTEIWKRKILKELTKTGTVSGLLEITDDRISIKTTEEELESAIGYNSLNRKMLQRQFNEVEFVVSKVEMPLPILVADKRIPLPSKNALKRISNLKLLEASYHVYKSISGHPDIYMCSDAKTIVVAPSFPDDIIADLLEAGYKVLRGNFDPGLKYPESARYNAVVTDEFMIHNLNYTDEVIKDTYKDRKFINVNQGYTRCNLLVLNNSTFITSDRGIEKILLNEGMKILYVDPKPVVLKGQKHGFFPGCCGTLHGKVLINGSLQFHPQETEISDFIHSVGMNIHELFNGKLMDNGSLFVFPVHNSEP